MHDAINKKFCVAMSCVHKVYRYLFGLLYMGRGSSVVRPLQAAAIEKDSLVRFPGRPARLGKNFSGPYVYHGWFIGIELVLNPTTWIHFLLDCVSLEPDNVGSFPSRLRWS